MGAVELSAAANRLEQDLRAGPLSRLAVQVPGLVTSTETVLAGLAQLAAAALPRRADPRAVADVLARLQAYLADDDARAEDALSELEALLAGTAHAAALAQVRRAVEDIEYTAALAPLGALALDLEPSLEGVA